MIILGIDPGNKQSGFVTVSYDQKGSKIVECGVIQNEILLDKLGRTTAHTIAIEWIQAMGMAVGKEVFETCMWVGRFAERAKGTQTLFPSGEFPPPSPEKIRLVAPNVILIPRVQLKVHHCGTSRATDGNIAQSLRDKYGEKGTKKEPGYFYGMASHAWQAFAAAAMLMEGAEINGAIKI